MAKTVNTSNLGYLGSDYQLSLVKCFIEDQQFFVSLYDIIDQNMFTDECLRRIVGLLKDRYSNSESVATYNDLELLIRTKVSDAYSVEQNIATLTKIREMSFSALDIIKDEAEKFFKQQNLTKALNKASDIIKKGNSKDYYVIEDIIKKALETNTKQDLGFRLFECVESDLSENYRQTISTGCPELDESLYGGLGKGELGLIVAPLGVGKAQPLTSKVLTPDGFKLMGEIKVGDMVIGRDGKSHKVTGVFPQGKRPIYKVSFINGTSCECDIEHLWTIQKRHGKKWKTYTLKEIIDKGIFTNKKRFKWIIPNNDAVEFNHQTDDIKFKTVAERQEYVNGFKWKISKGEVNKRIKLHDKNIAETLCFVCRSLGYSSSLTYNEKLQHYSIIIRQKNNANFITNIEYVREDEAQCIMVDSKEHLYITDDFIVTHNTSITTGFAAAAATHPTENNNFKGYNVLHFFFEDDEVNIRRKYYGHYLDIDACTLSDPNIRPQALQRLRENTEIKNMLKNNIISKRLSSGEVTASEIKNMIKKYIANGFNPDLVIIDYFECLKSEKNEFGGSSDEWSREGVTMRKLESICNEMKIAIWCPVQGTKGSIGQELVTLAHAGGSVKKTQIGHIILTLAQTDEQKSNGRLSLFIGKLRAAKIGRTQFRNVKFNNGTCKFDMDDLDNVDEVLGGNGISTTAQNIAKSVKQEYRNKL